MEKVFESCQNVLKGSSNNSVLISSTATLNQTELSYKKHAYLIVNTFISSLISSDDDQKALLNIFLNYKPLTATNTARASSYEILIHQLKTYRFDDEYLRQAVESALTCLFYATSVKEMRKSAISYLDTIVSHFTLLSLALLHQPDENCTIQRQNIFTTTNNYLDVYLIIDAMFTVLTNDDMDYWPIIQRELIIIIEINQIIDAGFEVNNKVFFDYLAEKMYQLCYERSWYAKKAG